MHVKCSLDIHFLIITIYAPIESRRFSGCGFPTWAWSCPQPTASLGPNNINFCQPDKRPLSASLWHCSKMKQCYTSSKWQQVTLSMYSSKYFLPRTSSWIYLIFVDGMIQLLVTNQNITKESWDRYKLV
jgi:hypothetical protein